MLAYNTGEDFSEYNKANRRVLDELEGYIRTYCVNASVNKAWPLYPYRKQDTIMSEHQIFGVIQQPDGEIIRNMVIISIKVHKQTGAGFVSKRFIVDVKIAFDKKLDRLTGRVMHIEECGESINKLETAQIKFSRGGNTTQGDIVQRMCGLKRSSGRQKWAW